VGGTGEGGARGGGGGGEVVSCWTERTAEENVEGDRMEWNVRR
jgi:hypothetical protein